jgi:hypothetical protein
MLGDFFPRVPDFKRGHSQLIIFLQIDPDIQPHAEPPAKT